MERKAHEKSKAHKQIWYIYSARLCFKETYFQVLAIQKTEKAYFLLPLKIGKQCKINTSDVP